MFSQRKYTPLPTSSANAGQRRRSGGGLPMWKRYILLGTAVVLVTGAGYVFMNRDQAEVSPDVYTPSTDNPPALDEGFKSPPFNPTYDDETPDGPDRIGILPVDDDHPFTGEYTKPEATASADKPVAEDPEDDTLPDDPPAGHPTSFETDVNPASTIYCTTPFEGKPLVQYALTIDAGSTGSRIHVYKFNNCGPSPQLEYETFNAIRPGLSSYAGDPTGAAKSLDPLMEEANRVVPESLRGCTPVEVKATAGLRLLGEVESTAILDECRNHLKTNYHYTIGGAESVEIMEGKNEGVYAWITANYLLNKIGEGVKTQDTIAVMDLGGASTQIVFEPRFPADSEQKLAEGDHKFSLWFGGKNFTLYQHSHLNYGLMRARRSIHNIVGFTWSMNKDDEEWDALTPDTYIGNPCLSRGTTEEVELDPPGRTKVKVTMTGANGGFDACNRVVELAIAKDAICQVEPCSFNGVYQPALIDTFKGGKVLALSYFTDRIAPLLDVGAPGELTLGTLGKLARDVCAGETVWRTRWAGNTNALEELEGRPEYCLDLTFMNALLSLGYELHDDRDLLVEKKIKGVELGWALGAGLALVEKADLKCLA